MLKFITINTYTQISHDTYDKRNVTLSYNGEDIRLLGSLQHNTIIVVDQKLVDSLQSLVDQQKEG